MNIPPPADPIRLEHRRLDLRLRHAWTLSRGTLREKSNVLVRLSGGGAQGIGEAAPNTRFGETWRTVVDALDRLAPALAEAPDPSAAWPAGIESLLDRLERLAPGDRAARAAIDIALHDRVARARNVPLHRLFGTDPGRMPPTSMSIGIDRPEVVQDRVREAAGFGRLKIKIAPDSARGILEAVRRVTDRPLLVDANEGWTDPDRAAEMIRWMEGIGVVLVEQPLPAADLEGARRLRRQVTVPIFADEAALTAEDLEALPGAYDGVNVKVQKAGGLRAAIRMIERARALGLSVLIGCMIETSIGITAAAHLAPLADHVDLDGNLLLAEDPYRGAAVRDGRLVLPKAPGIGIEVPW